MDYKNCQIHGKFVTIREVQRPMKSQLGDHYGTNVVDYNGKEYDVICNGQGDCFILVDGKKRWLEEPDSPRKINN